MSRHKQPRANFIKQLHLLGKNSWSLSGNNSKVSTDVQSLWNSCMLPSLLLQLKMSRCWHVVGLSDYPLKRHPLVGARWEGKLLLVQLQESAWHPEWCFLGFWLACNADWFILEICQYFETFPNPSFCGSYENLTFQTARWIMLTEQFCCSEFILLDLELLDIDQ